jgi:hypothetical protein
MKRLLLPLGLLLFGCTDYGINNKDVISDSGREACEDFEPTPVGALTVDTNCLRTPITGSFTPVIEWQWTDNPVHPSYNQIMAAPAIGNLDDDNQDGQVNEDDIPDVVFASFQGSAYSSAGTVTAIRGSDGTTLWSVLAPGGASTFSSSGIAIGDLEGDGQVEVCVSGTQNAVVCLNGIDGSLKWAAGTETSTYGCPAMADLDGDGISEVIFGRTILDNNGNILAIGTGGKGGPHSQSFAVDWDGDGVLEVIAGNTIYRADGSILWSDNLPDAAPAVGDFNMDGLPDLVRAGSGQVMVTLNDGSLLWSVSTQGGGNAGPPTVADFDGDGLPEVGVADLSRYTVYDTDGTVLWSNPTSDASSSKTGSSVFDFEGDGAAEVVYADELDLWIYDGATGAIKMRHDGHASGTLLEYPLIADVDNDGSTEIVLASNDYAKPGWRGITVIGDADDSWAPARPVWNQYAYHITNVNNDGTIPVQQTANWLSWNSFRAGGTELGPAHWLPDLSTDPPEICEEACADDRIVLSLPITNTGLIDAHLVTVLLKAQDGSTLLLEQVSVVPSGGGWIVGPIEITKSEWGSGSPLLFVDSPLSIDECHEDNNVRSLGSWPCP